MRTYEMRFEAYGPFAVLCILSTPGKNDELAVAPYSRAVLRDHKLQDEIAQALIQLYKQSLSKRQHKPA